MLATPPPVNHLWFLEESLIQGHILRRHDRCDGLFGTSSCRGHSLRCPTWYVFAFTVETLKSDHKHLWLELARAASPHAACGPFTTRMCAE